MTGKTYTEMLHPKQPGFVLVTTAYKKYNLMKYGISHFYQFHPEDKVMCGIPDACVDILFCKNGSKLETRIAGTLLEKTDVETLSSCSHFGIRFLPGFNPVGNILKMQELVGCEHVLDEMFASVAEREQLFEKIWTEDAFERKINAFLEYYLKHYDREKYESYNLASFLRKEIIQSGGNLKLNDLQIKTGYSLRYLNKVINDEFGVSPKELMRIIRFQKAIDGLTSNMQNMDMTDTALDAGYYDQSHFIKDFKEFTDHTPKKYINSLKQNCYKEKLQVIQVV